MILLSFDFEPLAYHEGHCFKSPMGPHYSIGFTAAVLLRTILSLLEVPLLARGPVKGSSLEFNSGSNCSSEMTCLILFYGDCFCVGALSLFSVPPPPLSPLSFLFPSPPPPLLPLPLYPSFPIQWSVSTHFLNPMPFTLCSQILMTQALGNQESIFCLCK